MYVLDPQDHREPQDRKVYRDPLDLLDQRGFRDRQQTLVLLVPQVKLEQQDLLDSLERLDTQDPRVL